MTLIVLLFALLFLPGPAPRPIEGSGPPIAREHVMDEQDVDSLSAALRSFDPVFVSGIDGVPASRAERERFLGGFRDAFGEKTLTTERVRRGAGAAVPGEALQNRMQLVTDEDGARWSVRIRIAWIAPLADSASAAASPDSLTRAWPGLGADVRVLLMPLGGRERETGIRSVEFDYRLRFPAGHPVDASYYQLAGRQVAFLALEALHRPEGRLDDDQRLVLEDTRREPAPAAR